MDEPTTLERLKHWKSRNFDRVGLEYTAELIHNAAKELEAAEARNKELHIALIEFGSCGGRDCIGHLALPETATQHQCIACSRVSTIIEDKS